MIACLTFNEKIMKNLATERCKRVRLNDVLAQLGSVKKIINRQQKSIVAVGLGLGE